MDGQQLAKRLLDLTSELEYKKRMKENLEGEIKETQEKLGELLEIPAAKVCVAYVEKQLAKRNNALRRQWDEIEVELDELEKVITNG